MPFTTDQFFDVFSAYNRAIWPAHVAAYLLAAVTLAAMVSRRTAGYRIAMGILGLLWLWNGAAYQLAFFSRINSAAYGFAALFALQALLFLAVAARAETGVAVQRRIPELAIATLLILYATVLYGLLGRLAGHAWPATPVFGVAPCPTTIFTFGMLLLSPRRVPAWLLIVPLIWAAIGSTAAILLSVPQDLGLLACGLAVVVWPVLRLPHRRGVSASAP